MEKGTIVGKKEKILKYISELPAGAKVSVRNLAKELSVSEGTAYKAIKLAEEMKLVETKDRAGTFRLQQDVLSEFKAVTLSDEIGRLGLSVLEGDKNTDVPIGRIIMGDGSFEQFKTSAMNAGPNALCLVGDRPDLLFFAASLGINIIATNGTQPGETLLATAREHSACVLSSVQDSSIILNFLRTDMKNNYQVSDSDLANRWMRTPPYLYYNDIVADWYSTYCPIFSLTSECAVVDDDLRICGNIDAARTLAAAPSTKIYSLYSNEETFAVDESTPMQDIAQQMIEHESLVCYVTRNGVLCGVVTSNDVLRYYQYNPSAGGAIAQLPTLELLSASEKRSVYTLQLGQLKTDSIDVLLNIIIIAAKKFCREHYGRECSFTSGTFFTKPAAIPGDIMVSCEIQQLIPSGLIFEVEMYGETCSYCRCIVTATANEEENEK